MTWNRAIRRVRLFVNGEVKNESNVVSNRNINCMNSGHPDYDIGLKRDSGTVAHAFFSDLMIFYRELKVSNSPNEIKSSIFLNHPLYESS